MNGCLLTLGQGDARYVKQDELCDAVAGCAGTAELTIRKCVGGVESDIAEGEVVRTRSGPQHSITNIVYTLGAGDAFGLMPSGAVVDAFTAPTINYVNPHCDAIVQADIMLTRSVFVFAGVTGPEPGAGAGLQLSGFTHGQMTPGNTVEADYYNHHQGRAGGPDSWPVNWGRGHHISAVNTDGPVQNGTNVAIDFKVDGAVSASSTGTATALASASVYYEISVTEV